MSKSKGTYIARFLLFLGLSHINLAIASVEISFGANAFSTSNSIYTHISFSDGGSSTLSGFPGGARDLYRYYDNFDYQGVEFSTLSRNSNLPGFFRYSDILDDGQREFFDQRGGDYLVAGLAPDGLGMRLDFSKVGRPVSAVGMAWGNVMTGGSEPSPCCIQHSFRFVFDDGTEELITLGPGNYLGRGRELLMSDYIGFTIASKNFVSLDIVQRGHNPGIDNVAIGTKGSNRRSVKPRVSIETGGNEPEKSVVIQYGDENTRTLEEYYEHLCSASDVPAEVQKKFEILEKIPFINLYYKQNFNGGKQASGAVARLHASRCPNGNLSRINARSTIGTSNAPRFDYDVESIYQPRDYEYSFQTAFGARYQAIDDFFRNFLYVADATELAIQSSLRLQGAIIDEADAKIDKQRQLFEHWLSEVEFGYEELAVRAVDIEKFHREEGFDDVIEGDVSFYGLWGFLPRLFLDMRTQSQSRKTIKNNTWEQISLPNVHHGMFTVSEAFSDEIPAASYGTNWVLYEYNVNQRVYQVVDLDDFLIRGRAYWMIQLTGTSVILDLPVSTEPSQATSEADCTGTRCVSIPLESTGNTVSWNMIGYPFSDSQSGTSFRISTGIADNCMGGCTLTEGSQANLISDSFWHFDSDLGEYVNTNPGDIFNPWYGYWAAVLADSAISSTRLLVPDSLLSFQ